MLEHGPTEQSIAKQHHYAGLPLPDRIANAPELFLGSEFYLQAFFDLDSERSHGMGLVHIPRSAIRDYAIEYELDENETDDLHCYIRAMDNVNLKYLEDQMPKPKS